MMIDRFTGVHSFLSNFAPTPITFDGITYPTVEHFFQAQKGATRMEREGVAAAATPALAKRAGRAISLRPDWEAAKLNVMRNGLELKFAPAGALAGQLQATHPHYLVEGNTWGDTYWGRVNGYGWNWLGHLLVARRQELLG